MRRFNLADPPFTYDPEEPEGYRAGMYRYGAEAGAKLTGTSVYELPPGQGICPYHYEVGEEEWLLVLSGHPTLRTPEGFEQLDPLDSVFFTTGPDGTHAVQNHTGETVRVMMYSNVTDPAVCYYPDADKVGVHTGDERSTGNFPRTARMEYYEGEPSPPIGPGDSSV